MSITFEQVGRTFAGKAEGVALSPPCDAGAIQTILAALDRFGVVVLAGQKMTPDEQIAFSEQLGPLENSDEGNPKYRKLREDMKYTDQRVSEISNLVDGATILGATDMRRIFQYANQFWHADSTFRPVRARYTFLQAILVPQDGGDTEFADMAMACEELPQALREEVEGLIGIHSPRTIMDHLGATRPDQGGFFSELPDQPRPIIETHPGSGRQVLNIGSHLSHIEGMSMPEGRALIAALREHACDPRYRYRHRWTPGDLVIWDNRSTLHRACRYRENDQPRQLVRTLVEDR